MKKILPGILAIAMAFGLFAFTDAPVKKTLNTQFRYVGPSSPVDYESEDNWQVSSMACASTGSLKCLVTPQSAAIDTKAELVEEIQNHDFDNITTNSSRP